MSDPAAALSVLAQISVTLTGFAGLLTAFRGRLAMSATEYGGVRILLITSVSALGFSLAPIPPLLIGADETLLWTASLASLSGFLLLLAIGAVDMRFRGGLKPRSGALFWLLTLGLWALAALLALAALDINRWRSPATYVAGLSALIGVAAVQFLVQIFHNLRAAERPKRRKMALAPPDEPAPPATD